MFNKKSVRILVGVLLFVILVVSFVPSVYLHQSSDGIVNAYTTTLKSPIEGVVTFDRKVKMGMKFKKGNVFGKVVNNRIDRSLYHQLLTEKKSLECRVKTLTERMKVFEALKKRLSSNTKNYQKYSVIQTQNQIKQVEDQLTHGKAEFKRAEKEYEANKKLAAKNALKQREFETSEANYLMAQAKVQELKDREVELKNSLTAIQSGVFLGDGHNDVPYSSQRLDQLIFEIQLAKTTLNEAKNRVAGIKQQLAEEKKRLTLSECYQIKAPFEALVWRLPVTEGSTVVIGAELVTLLDCSSIFLDIVLSESQFSDVKAGDIIEYRLMGETNYHKATVFALRGSGSDLGNPNLAADVKKDPKKEFRIMAYPDPKDMHISPKNFYQVGRRVEVKVRCSGHFWEDIVRFFNVF